MDMMQNMLPAQPLQQAVVVKHTFIEVVDSCVDDQSPLRLARRHFSDSEILRGPRAEAEALSEACSTGEEGCAEEDLEERSGEFDGSDDEGALVLPGVSKPACAGGRARACDSAVGGSHASPRDARDLSWRHLRTMSSFGDEACPARKGGGLAPPSALPATSYEASASTVEANMLPQVGSPRASPRDARDLSWRHLRTMSSFGDEACPARTGGGLAPPSALPAASSEASGSTVEANMLPPAQQPTQSAEQPAPFVAVLVPAVFASCIAPAAANVAEAAAEDAATPRSPRAPAAPERRTTVLLRNIPNNYKRAQLLALLDRKGLAGLYDFAYLPVDFRTGAALGYAFVNLVDFAAAQLLWDKLDGFCRWVVPSRKRCRVSWSDPHQGLRENVARYQNSPVMHPSVPDAFKPVVFASGVRIPYPRPTKSVREPRLRT